MGLDHLQIETANALLDAIENDVQLIQAKIGWVRSGLLLNDILDQHQALNWLAENKADVNEAAQNIVTVTA